MVNYFGINIREKSDGLKLTRENYVKVSYKSSFRNNVEYSDSFVKEHRRKCLYNFDLNMGFFHSLSKQSFNENLTKFIQDTKSFKEVLDLSFFDMVSGYYIMVLDEYSQIYIGQSNNIKKRILTHWSKQKEFDRLIFGGTENSILSIDSFRPYDTTRIFIHTTSELNEHEDKFINLCNKKYLLNRTAGGKLDGLGEAIKLRKSREL